VGLTDSIGERVRDAERVLGREIEMKFAWIPPGRFLMGSDEDGDEQPVHRVTITKGFWMGIFPVTQDQFEAVMGYNPSHFRGPTHPVANVSWLDAQEFCAAFVKLTGRPIRLPTEAEWEYACRATTTSAYWSGNEEAALKGVGWYGGDDKPSRGQSHPVGELAKNRWGLYDVHGNVYEWCEDCFAPYQDEDQTDPCQTEDQSSEHRVVRGGAWEDDPETCRAAWRGCRTATDRLRSVGFRVCFRLA
jgi:formylglycine-generating enzyme required for sulfatase activity